MITNEERDILIQYRIKQSKATRDEAKLLIDNAMYNAAMNRIYYSLFYMILALGLKYEFETSKHQQLIGWFNRTFIKENIIERKYGKLLQESYDFRQKGDYEPFLEFSEIEVKSKFVDSEEFIAVIEAHIQIKEN